MNKSVKIIKGLIRYCITMVAVIIIGICVMFVIEFIMLVIKGLYNLYFI